MIPSTLIRLKMQLEEQENLLAEEENSNFQYSQQELNRQPRGGSTP
jgi:hypothetical protein